MSRPQRTKLVKFMPCIKGFKPFGRNRGQQQLVILTVDEFEVIRLLDYIGLSQEEAATEMQISRPTLTRIYEHARNSIAKAFVEGASISIEGGSVSFSEEMYECTNCHTTYSMPIDHSGFADNCPQCHSEKVTNLNNCFRKGCHRCHACKPVHCNIDQKTNKEKS